MIEAYYNFVHSIGLHLYTIPTILCLGIFGGVGIGHGIKQKKREEEFNNELNGGE